VPDDRPTEPSLDPSPAPGTEPEAESLTAARARFSRRRVLGATGAGVAGAAVGLAGGIGVARASVQEPAPAGPAVYPFYGEHQAGITTPAQDRLHFAAFDVTTSSRTDLVELLQDWTAAAARMTQGEGAGAYGPTSGPYYAPPDDTGERSGCRRPG